MTDEKPTSPEFQRYAFANVGAIMSKDKSNAMYIPGAVDLLGKNLNFGDDGKDLYDWFVTEKQTNKLLDIYNKKFYTKQTEATVADIYNFYKPALTNVTDEQKALVDGAFGKYAGENYSKLKKDIAILHKKLELLEEEGGKEEEMVEIQKQLQEYNEFMLADKLLNDYNYENLRYQAVEASKPTSFGNLEKLVSEISRN